MFNIHLPHYNAFGVKHYQRLHDVLTNPKGANMKQNTVYLVPNVVNLDQSIEIRAQTMAQTIERTLAKTGHSKCHIAAHSFTGIDARAAISMYGQGENVKSLTTVCSPHLGMMVLDVANEDRVDKQHIGIQNLEKTFEVLGITGRAVQEFTPFNMGAFNEVCEDHPNVEYYSIGAKKGGRVMNIMLRDGYEMITNHTFGEQIDGIVRDVEARWGHYLMTFENDHMEVIGFTPGHNPANVFNLVADNTRLAEIRSDKDLSYEYGLDKMFESNY